MDKSPKEIVEEGMYAKDQFSKWLGIEIVSVESGSCILKMEIKKEMLNGFEIAHGGITYSFADSALAFASNSMGMHAVSIETSISHTSKVVLGDILTARTKRVNQTRKFAIYSIDIRNQEDVLVADFKGTVYFTGKEW